MTRHQAQSYIDRFLNPAGLTLLTSIILLAINTYASIQLLPIAGTISLLDQRLKTVEKRIDDQQLIIIPKGELDAKFENILIQLEDLKSIIRNK